MAYSFIDFQVDSVLSVSESKMQCNYLFAEVMWYILEDLNKIIKNITSNCKGNYILINQTFYPEGCQKYGSDFFATVDQMIDYLPWECIEKVVEYDKNSYDTHTVFKVE